MSILFKDGSEESLIRLIRLAELELKIFVYPIPDGIRRCNKPFKGGLRDMFDMELRLPKYYKTSVVATQDPEMADLYLVDHEWICLRVGSEPSRRAPDRFKFTGHAIGRDHVLPIWRNVLRNYPYFNRSHGHDHITSFVYDNGPFCSAGHIQPTSSPAVAEVMGYLTNVSILGNNGYSGRSVWEKHCEKPCEGRQSYLFCHREGRDIVLPQPHPFPPLSSSITYYPSSRPAVTLYRGQIRQGTDCSPLIRPLLQHMHSPAGVRSNSSLSSSHHWWQTGRMNETVFALCPAGAACWSMRLYHALFSDTVPVILADRIIVPFERFLDWKQFSMKLMTGEGSESDVGDMLRVLHNMAEESKKSSNLQNTVVGQKVLAMREVSPWLSFDPRADRNAYRLLTLELWCRTAKGRRYSSCHRPVAYIANISYFF